MYCDYYNKKGDVEASPTECRLTIAKCKTAPIHAERHKPN